jgi:UDPglucose--hexose-1-phosphate uridylyltransferase
MPELRKDLVTGHWVIISTERSKRPTDYRPARGETKPSACPFCPGHEAQTPSEILALRPGGGAANGPGWQVRVIPNKFPVLQVEGELDRQGQGLFDTMNGIGAHEVIIDTPQHGLGLGDLAEAEVERVLWVFHSRCQDLRKDLRMRYLLVFKNHGDAAGATLEHSHSQLIATPVIPSRVLDKLEGSKRYYREKERCIYCDLLRQELAGRERLVMETEHFAVLAPFASRFPFELLILPKRHGHDYGDLDQALAADLAKVLKQCLGRLKKALSDPAYNFLIHSAPLREDCGSYFHWHLELMPRLTKIAGFEWGTGFYINPTQPEEAAKYLRQMETEPTGIPPGTR